MTRAPRTSPSPNTTARHVLRCLHVVQFGVGRSPPIPAPQSPSCCSPHSPVKTNPFSQTPSHSHSRLAFHQLPSGAALCPAFLFPFFYLLKKKKNLGQCNLPMGLHFGKLVFMLAFWGCLLLQMSWVRSKLTTSVCVLMVLSTLCPKP